MGLMGTGISLLFCMAHLDRVDSDQTILVLLDEWLQSHALKTLPQLRASNKELNASARELRHVTPCTIMPCKRHGSLFGAWRYAREGPFILQIHTCRCRSLCLFHMESRPSSPTMASASLMAYQVETIPVWWYERFPNHPQ